MGQLRTANKRQKMRAAYRPRHDAIVENRIRDRATTAVRALLETQPDDTPVDLIDVAEIPGGGELRLLRCGPDFVIHFGDEELMGSQATQSEQALAKLAIRHLARPCGHMLIGGLGMGFTLNAARAALPATAAITVAELVPKILTWAQGPLAHLFGDALADPRVTIAIKDVHDIINAAEEAFDAILLDVDNGPDGLIQLANDRLYCNWGLRAAFAALRPGGVLAIWSAYEDDVFFGRLEKTGFVVDEMKVDDTEGRERAPYTIWLASRPA